MTRATCRTALVILGGVAAVPGPAGAFEAAELPADNLLENPWFRSATPGSPGFGAGIWLRTTLSGEQTAAQASGDQRPPDSLTIGLSQKASNPSPDPRAAPDCGNDPSVFCGTALRWAEDRAEGCNLDRVGLDAYVEQIVTARDPEDRFLRFSAWWVAHRIAVLEVVIAGSDDPAGPWTDMWTPLRVESPAVDLAASVPGGSQSDRSVEWMFVTCGALECDRAPVAETQLERGFAFYRVQIHARYPDLTAAICGVGAKMTGVYLATSDVGGPGGDGGGEEGDGPGDGAGDPSGGCRAGPRTPGAATGLALLAFALGAGLGRRRASARARR